MIREVKRFDAERCRMSNALLDQYWSADPFLRPFYRHLPHWDSVEAAMHDRDRFSTDRETLVMELVLQNQPSREKYPRVWANIDALRNPNCYTVTTGHQLCLATGPLFFLYKIVSAINLSIELNKRHPGKYFVPVYWMATEDHDIGEIDHFQLSGQTIRARTNWKGPSGRQVVDDLSPVWEELQNLLKGKPQSDQVLDMFRQAYDESSNLAEATRSLVLNLFGEYGLVVFDADRPDLKRGFMNAMRQELLAGAAKPVVEEVIARMQHRHKPQVHVRELNLFYLQDHRRDRIVRSDDGLFRIQDTDLVFSGDEIERHLRESPERFSPNVILRPLYQETLLPNVATVGGPAEIAYWLLLMPLFEQHGIPYPILVPRNQALLISSRLMDKFIKQGFIEDDIFLPAEELSAQWLMRNESFQPTLEAGRVRLREVFDNISGLFAGIDATLEPSVKAEAQRVMNGLDQLERKGFAALRRRHELALAKITDMAGKVRPNGSPQERVENFSRFASDFGTVSFVKALMDNLSPLDPRITVLVTE